MLHLLEARPARELRCPSNRGPTSPLVGREREYLAARPAIQIGAEVVERTLHVAEHDRARRAMEGCLDDGVAPGVEVPRTRGGDAPAAGEVDPRHGVVLHHVGALAERLAAGEQAALGLL